MQGNKFTVLDIHKSTISVAVAHGKRGGEDRHRGTFMACIARLSSWGMTAL